MFLKILIIVARIGAPKVLKVRLAGLVNKLGKKKSRENRIQKKFVLSRLNLAVRMPEAMTNYLSQAAPGAVHGLEQDR